MLMEEINKKFNIRVTYFCNICKKDVEYDLQESDIASCSSVATVFLKCPECENEDYIEEF